MLGLDLQTKQIIMTDKFTTAKGPADILNKRGPRMAHEKTWKILPKTITKRGIPHSKQLSMQGNFYYAKVPSPLKGWPDVDRGPQELNNIAD